MERDLAIRRVASSVAYCLYDREQYRERHGPNPARFKWRAATVVRFFFVAGRHLHYLYYPCTTLVLGVVQ